MAVSVNWGTKVITVPQADLTLVSGTLYEYSVDTLRLALKALEDDEEGMPFPDTHQHFASVTVGNVTLAKVVEFINDYTITFEDGQYGVNLYGANHNVLDVINRNQVSVASANSAGLVEPPVDAILDEPLSDHEIDGTVGDALHNILWRTSQ
ncbi:MAG: hypothetical protein AMJ55_00380 [Gammaproteobacteria bacterium SG8_15]|nr:MAG: hypothetical protein AMJ55_00380 [Gammaproteobacteria bacterium SG8_15]